MATKIYETCEVELLDEHKLIISPLKIKFLREFMIEFENVKMARDDEEAIERLASCVAVCMKQFRPEISTKELVEDVCDMSMIYKIIEFAANIKLNEASEEPVKEQAQASGSTWDDLDLAKLEAEVFILGIWKDYKELEESLSMPELMVTLSSKRELDYEEKRFLAAIQGVDLDSSTNSDKGQKEWEDMKARVFSGGATSDSNDVLSLQGQNAKKAGFGIGMGLDYEDARDPSLMKN
jgi:hypothetical protein